MGNQCKISLIEDPDSTLEAFRKKSPKKSKIIKDIEALKKR